MNHMTDRAYLDEGVRRMETGEVKGSHAAGVFSRCAADFESTIRVWFGELLGVCRLDYERDIRAHCKDVALHKATLGSLIAGIRQVAVVKRRKDVWRAKSLLSAISPQLSAGWKK